GVHPVADITMLYERMRIHSAGLPSDIETKVLRLGSVASDSLGRHYVGMMKAGPPACELGATPLRRAAAAQAPVATSSDSSIISRSELWRSSALSSAWVIRQSVMVQMASACRSKRAASM